MKRLSRAMEKRFARLEAEDRAVAYLGELDPLVALAIALRVEFSLAAKCAAEQMEMRRQRDFRKVVIISVADFRDLYNAFSAMPPNVQVDPADERHVLDLFAAFSSDWAWWVAHKVTKWAKFNAHEALRRPLKEAALGR